MDERALAISEAEAWFDDGQFESELASRVACATESQMDTTNPALRVYLEHHLVPWLDQLGFSCSVHGNPIDDSPPFLVAERLEGDSLPTVLGYGHGDVVDGQAESWQSPLEPFQMARVGDRLYGRGTADNKGQHVVNLAALQALLNTRGCLGFNAKFIFEMGEEIGSPGLAEFLASRPDLLKADVFIASDGPRLQQGTPTVFLGSRGCINFQLSVALRDAAHHSGNWGGLLRDPAITLTHAIASISSANGEIRVPAWRPTSLTPAVQSALSGLPVDEQAGPTVDRDWGESSLSPAERVFGWNSFAVLALQCGTPESPQNAIAGTATAHCQLRFVVGTEESQILPALRTHLDQHGFHRVDISSDDIAFSATRVEPDNPWVQRVTASIERTTQKSPHVLPNLGGSIPNACFLPLPTIWVPHSYRGCSQHAPNEHASLQLCREGLQIMTGLYYDLGSHDGSTC